MISSNNIERNKIDYLLTDIMPVEVSELFSYGKFYEFLLKNKKEVEIIIKSLVGTKAKGDEIMFNGGLWASAPLKYNILKGVDGVREINLAQPISALNLYFFIECYQKEILSYLGANNCFSLRYHKKNNDLFYKRRSNKQTEYFAKTSKKIEKSILQQTGAYFKIHKFNSVSSFTNSKIWQQCNFKYRYFAKVDYKSCFDSIYTHTYKWIIERDTIDSKEAKNSNLFITIDRVLQNINGKSSNGIIVGPEASRMIAEILLQHIDKETLQELQAKGFRLSKDFRIFRYVDDIYIFANNPITIETIIRTIELTAQKYLLRLNELKYYTSETPVVLNGWIEKTRIFSDKISNLFFTKKEAHSDGKNYLIKNGYISLDRLKNEFSLLMTEFPKDRRYIVSYALSTLLNNIGNKKDGYKLFDHDKEGKAYIFLELAFFIYSFCPCFEHTQKILSMIVYFDDELKFKNDEKQHKKLVKLIRNFSFIFEKANLNDICNWFILFYEYDISLFKSSEDIIFERIVGENNPILWANYLIYSQYNDDYNKFVLRELEQAIVINTKQLLSCNFLLQKEFWYVLVFCNCPYLSASTKRILQSEVLKLYNTGTSSCERANNLIYRFLDQGKSNQFFYWGYHRFDTCKQLTYRTYQRTLFKQYKSKKMIELYGSLDS